MPDRRDLCGPGQRGRGRQTRRSPEAAPGDRNPVSRLRSRQGTRPRVGSERGVESLRPQKLRIVFLEAGDGRGMKQRMDRRIAVPSAGPQLLGEAPVEARVDTAGHHGQAEPEPVARRLVKTYPEEHIRAMLARGRSEAKGIIFLGVVNSSGNEFLISDSCSFNEIEFTSATIFEHSPITSLTFFRSSALLPRIFDKTVLSFVLPSCSTAF